MTCPSDEAPSPLLWPLMRTPSQALLHPAIPGREPAHSGKVREMYDLGDAFLMVTSDRLSAFDVIFPTPIPAKGRVLTAISTYWFGALSHLVENHFIEEPSRDWLATLTDGPDQLLGRTMRVRKCEPLKVECVVRGSLEGSAFKEYRDSGCIQEHRLPAGLKLHDDLPEPLFTPSTKADAGHDESITFKAMTQIVGEELSTKLRDVSLKLFVEARRQLAAKGIHLADTKFEFGLADGELILIDEALTPDSSRFLIKDTTGRVLQMDKQFVRDWIETTDWNKKPPAPPLPDEVVAQTSARYREIAKLITGREVD